MKHKNILKHGLTLLAVVTGLAVGGVNSATVNATELSDYGQQFAKELIQDDTEEEPLVGGDYDNNSINIHAQNYGRTANPVNSYLTEVDGGFLRVSNVQDGVLIENYDKDFNLLSYCILERELELFGGFYAGEESYYLVFGQQNKEEDNEKEVIRIVKYDKNWERLGAASLYGANTIYPFNAGSLRMSEYGGQLFVRTCHTMYTSGDGLNHQANLSIMVDTATMEIMDSFTSVWNIGNGYVSHSFNQFIQVTEDGVYAVDHGDYYPRSIVLGRYEDFDVSSNYTFVRNLTMQYPNKLHYNYTGATVGGFEISEKAALVAGSSVVQDADWESYNVQNIWLSRVPLDDFTEDAAELIWITDYKEGEGVSATTPHLVKIDEDNYALLWETADIKRATNYSNNYHNKVYMVLLDGEGNVKSDVMEIDGVLSDCKPIYANNQIVWYVTQYGEPTFYTIFLNMDVEDFVTRMYEVTLDRTPDAEGLSTWTMGLLQGKFTGQDIAKGFIMSKELTAKNLDDGAYVDVLYQAFFGRAADAAGKQTWVDLLEAGKSREFVLAGFVNSEEFDALCAEYGIIRGTMEVTKEYEVSKEGIQSFVERLYSKVLGRSGDATGIETWVNVIAGSTMSAEEVSKKFFFSEEYLLKNTSDEDFVKTLYQTFMDRAADADGQAFWLSYLAGGADRTEVLEGFSRSVEFAEILKSYGLAE